MINDAFAVENLKAEANWSGFEFLPGLLFPGGRSFHFYPD
jgi:hypothetical protein